MIIVMAMMVMVITTIITMIVNDTGNNYNANFSDVRIIVVNNKNGNNNHSGSHMKNNNNDIRMVNDKICIITFLNNFELEFSA